MGDLGWAVVQNQVVVRSLEAVQSLKEEILAVVVGRSLGAKILVALHIQLGKEVAARAALKEVLGVAEDSAQVAVPG